MSLSKRIPSETGQTVVPYLNPLLLTLITLVLVFTVIIAYRAEAEESPSAQNSSSEKTQTDAPFDTQRPQSPDRQQLDQWLTNSAKPEQIQWLEGETRFLALYNKQLSVASKGGIILLPPIDNHVGWPSVLRGLLDYLPVHGWNSLVISMPAHVGPHAIAEQPASEQTAVAPDSNANSNTVEDAAQSTEPAIGSKAPSASDIAIGKRLTAARTFLNEQGQFNLVIIAMDSGSGQAVDFIRQQGGAAAPSGEGQPIGSVQALIIINANSDLSTQLSTLRIPILDIVQNLNPEIENYARQRMMVMQSQPPALYQQIHLPLTGGHQQDVASDPLIKRIRGWLDRYISGTQMKAVYR